MKRRYNLDYKLVYTEQEAKDFCECQNKTGSYYKRKTYPATYHSYECNNGWKGFICWYRY